jgi:hypothetical protein
VTSKLTRLLNTCSDIGGIYNLTFEDAIVLTSDFAKHEHGGIAQGQWLLASACKGSAGNYRLDDEEIVLLRVTGVAPLPNERDLVAGRMAVVRDAHATERDYDEVLDVHTKAEHQQSALACDVIGVFYSSVTDEEKVEFGAELDNVWSAAHYRVFMPSTKALSWIASYPKSPDSLEVGVVRFSATRRNAQKHGMDSAAVSVNVSDFISRKTAILGITRGGKSNSIKTICSATYEYAASSGTKIGQIIFDPQGEYARVNAQDGTGLRLLGDENQVRIYSASPSKTDPHEHPLRLNFYDTDLFDVAWDMVQGSMEGADANYVRTFRSADMERPDANDFRAQTHWGRGYMAFYGLLYRAGYKGKFANGASINFSMKDETAAQFNSANPDGALSGGSSVYTVTSPEQAAAVVDWVNMMISAWDKASKGTKDEDAEEASRLEALIEAWTRSDQFIAVADVFKYAKGRGLAGLRELREFHDPTGRGDIGAKVWDDMTEGRLVIVDLSIGSATVTKTMSERLITHLVGEASARFREGLTPHPFQVVVEEAHNLFERGRNALDDPWVRMSKEAAKYKIGLIYATQEVTSVDQRILSNTQNWIITHFNSDIEIRELAKYYDFGNFGGSIKRAEEAGYARVKTFSSPFIVPVQIAKFDHAMVNRARVAAGLKMLPGHGEEAVVVPIKKPLTVKKASPAKTRIVGTSKPSGLASLGDGEFS